MQQLKRGNNNKSEDNTHTTNVSNDKISVQKFKRKKKIASLKRKKMARYVLPGAGIELLIFVTKFNKL